MDEFKDVIIEGSLEGAGTGRYENYLAHALCLKGELCL